MRSNHAENVPHLGHIRVSTYVRRRHSQPPQRSHSAPTRRFRRRRWRQKHSAQLLRQVVDRVERELGQLLEGDGHGQDQTRNGEYILGVVGCKTFYFFLFLLTFFFCSPFRSFHFLSFPVLFFSPNRTLLLLTITTNERSDDNRSQPRHRSRKTSSRCDLL